MPLSFKTWVRKSKRTNDPVGDFIHDAKHDTTLPEILGPAALKAYLISQEACPECLALVPKIWERYQRQA